MRILINCTNLKKGGGLQIGHSFLNELELFSEDQYFIVLSKELFFLLNTNNFPENFKFYHSEGKDNYGFFIKQLRLLRHIEKKTRPDIVFTVLGPSYTSFKAKHVCGFAIAHFLYNESP